MGGTGKEPSITVEDMKQFLDTAPTIIKKAFGLVLQRRKEIQEKRKQLREEFKRGTRKGKL